MNVYGILSQRRSDAWARQTQSDSGEVMNQSIPFTRRWRLGALGIVLATTALVAGCASTVSARVTSFEHWPMGVQGQSYRLMAQPDQADNLEYRSYQDMVRASIGATGLVEVPAGAPARFDVVFDYGSIQTQVMTRQPYDPYFHGGYGRGFGHYGYGAPWGWGGYWGPAWVDVPSVAYRNTLNLRIADRNNGSVEVYRSSASTLTGHPNLLQSMPYLTRAIFDNFPGNNGTERVVEFDNRSDGH